MPLGILQKTAVEYARYIEFFNIKSGHQDFDQSRFGSLGLTTIWVFANRAYDHRDFGYRDFPIGISAIGLLVIGFMSCSSLTTCSTLTAKHRFIVFAQLYNTWVKLF